MRVGCVCRATFDGVRYDCVRFVCKRARRADGRTCRVGVRVGVYQRGDARLYVARERKRFYVLVAVFIPKEEVNETLRRDNKKSARLHETDERGENATRIVAVLHLQRFQRGGVGNLHAPRV